MAYVDDHRLVFDRLELRLKELDDGQLLLRAERSLNLDSLGPELLFSLDLAQMASSNSGSIFGRAGSSSARMASRFSKEIDTVASDARRAGYRRR